MKHTGKLFLRRVEHKPDKTEPPRIETTGRHLTLALVDERAYREHGYNPYDTIAHARDTRHHDIWRRKPKRS
jgi:hypothetical protein